MYKIVLKVPEVVFFVFIFLPIFLIIGGYFPQPSTGMILSFLGLATGVFWLLGVNDYVDKASGKKNPDWIFYGLLSIVTLSASKDVYENFSQNSFYSPSRDFPIITIVLDLIMAIWLTLKVKKIFPQRSTWFILVELMAYAFGVATLTPEIKNHYRENRKKMDRIFDGENDEEILN